MPTTAQTVSDLRTLVARRAGVARKVALLSTDPQLVSALEQNRCRVLVDPGSSAELAAFEPEVVIAFDGFGSQHGDSFALLATAAPKAELVFSFANAASGSALLRGLLGLGVAPGLGEPEVRAWLSAAGYVVTSRDPVVLPPAPLGLAVDTEASVRALFEQLNPDAAVDRLVLVARRGSAPAPVERVADLTSVVVTAGPELAALQLTLGGLAAQHQHPLEVVLVSGHAPDLLERATSRLGDRSGLTVRLLASASADPAMRANAGLAAARGRYVACVEAGAVLQPPHLGALVGQLMQGTAAWALSMPPQHVTAPFRLAQWLELGAVDCARWLVDRDRLGCFALTFAEGSPHYAQLLFTRLALLFSPAFVAGPVTVEVPRPAPKNVGGLLEQLRGRPLRTLATLESLFERPTLSAVARGWRRALMSR